MTSFEEKISPQDIEDLKKSLGRNENPDDTLEPPEQREPNMNTEFQGQVGEAESTVAEINALLDHVDGLDNEEPGMADQLNGVMTRITEAIQKSNILKTAITVGALFSPAAAFGGELNGRLNDNLNIGIESLHNLSNSREATLKQTLQNNPSHYINLKKLVNQNHRGHIKMGPNSLQAVTEAITNSNGQKSRYSLQSVTEAAKHSNSNKLGRIQLHNNPLGSVIQSVELSNQIEINSSIHFGSINGVQMNTLQQNTLKKVDTFHKKILPGATINGAQAYEIAPGVYGTEDSIYSNGVRTGVIEITD